MRMKIEDTENEVDHVKNKNDPDYFNKPLQFSRDFFVFYVWHIFESFRRIKNKRKNKICYAF